MTLMPIRGPGSEGPPVTTDWKDPFSYILNNQDEVLRDLGITPPGYEVAGNPFQFLDKYVRGLPILREYGNALLSPFMRGGLDAQPLGGSGLVYLESSCAIRTSCLYLYFQTLGLYVQE